MAVSRRVAALCGSAGVAFLALSSAALADDKLSDEMKASIETCRSLVRFCFLAIDDTLKLDCGSLRRIDDPLRSIIEEITRD